MQKQVGIFLFNEIEVLDFAGPFEVFSLASKDGAQLFKVHTIAQSKEPVTARNGLTVMPGLDFKDDIIFDILIIPGGYGAEKMELNNKIVIDWLKAQYEKVSYLASVCTGALLLAKAGLLSNKKATTHWMDLERLKKEFSDIDVISGVKFVDAGKIITSGGISAGINMSLHLVKKIYGIETARETATKMEYDLEI